MEFYTAFNRPESVEAERGSETAPTYEYRIDKKTGKKKLVQTGETNIYEMIQASLESSKLENIIKKFTAGDLSVLNQIEGQYLDISEIPTNLMDIQNMIYKCKGEFEKLDPETRSKFENSVEKYISLYGSEEWANNMGFLKETKEPEKETKETTGKGEEKVNE